MFIRVGGFHFLRVIQSARFSCYKIRGHAMPVTGYRDANLPSRKDPCSFYLQLALYMRLGCDIKPTASQCGVPRVQHGDNNMHSHIAGVRSIGLLCRFSTIMLVLLIIGTTIHGCTSTTDLHGKGKLTISEVDAPAYIRSLGSADTFFQISNLATAGQDVSIPLKHEHTLWFHPESLRLALWDPDKHQYEIINDSKFYTETDSIRGKLTKDGKYGVFGYSKIYPVYDIQTRTCGRRIPQLAIKPVSGSRIIDPICTRILCASIDPEDMSRSLSNYTDMPVSPDAVSGRFQNLCDQCLEGDRGSMDYPECHISGFAPDLSNFFPAPLPWCHVPQPGPDLAPKDVNFDENGVLLVTLRNEGEQRVLEGTGSIIIHIDGIAESSYKLDDLEDASFREPDGQTTIQTTHRLSGSDRRISVYVDYLHELEETNELQNTISRTLTPPVQNGPDLVIERLRREFDGSLTVTIKNTGNAASRVDLPARITAVRDGDTPDEDSVLLPAIAPNSMIEMNSSLRMESDGWIHVEIATGNLLDEIDNTNNSRREYVVVGTDIEPEYIILEPYESLLADPRIANNIIWNGRVPGSISLINAYPEWSPEQQNDLKTAILRIEHNLPLLPSSPPEVIDGSIRFSEDDAWNIFLSHVAQSLWIEAHDVVDWSLFSFTDEQLAYLLDNRQLIHRTPGGEFLFAQRGGTGAITAWNPRISYEFITNLQILRPRSQLATIYKLTDWMRAHLLHGNASLPEDRIPLFDYEGYSPADKILYPLEGRQHITGGCWVSSGLYSAILRSVNIPVERSDIVLFGDSIHSRPIFISVNRSMPHGDDPYDETLQPSGTIVPSSALFYTLKDMDTHFISPEVDCLEGTDTCNTIGMQASYNASRNKLGHAVRCMTDYLLHQYALYWQGPEYLRDSLRGPRVGGVVYEDFVRPYYTPEEIDVIMDDVRNSLIETGSGNLEVGKELVRERVYIFNSNR